MIEFLDFVIFSLNQFLQSLFVLLVILGEFLPVFGLLQQFFRSKLHIGAQTACLFLFGKYQLGQLQLQLSDPGSWFQHFQVISFLELVFILQFKMQLLPIAVSQCCFFEQLLVDYLEFVLVELFEGGDVGLTELRPSDLQLLLLQQMVSFRLLHFVF